MKISNKHSLLTILFFVWLLVLDFFSKYLFYDLRLLESTDYFEPILNMWISFWLLVNNATVYIISIVMLIFGVILWLENKIHWTIAALFLAWLVGNFIDRLFLWGVRDFIVFWDYFIFNLADVFLNMAVLLLIIEEIYVVWKNRTILTWKK